MNRPSVGIAERQTQQYSLSRIFLFENNDAALPIWRDSSRLEHILVHVGAHRDRLGSRRCDSFPRQISWPIRARA